MQTQWVTTNIRIPKDVYNKLKEEAFKQKKSFSALVREKIGAKKGVGSKKEVERFMKDLAKLRAEITRQNKGISLSQKLIEMRYEQ